MIWCYVKFSVYTCSILLCGKINVDNISKCLRSIYMDQTYFLGGKVELEAENLVQHIERI